MTREEEILDKDKFELLYSITKQWYDSLIAFQFRFTGFILLVLGWLITTENTKNFIRSHKQISNVSIPILLIFTVALHAIWVYRHYQKNNSTYRRLREFCRQSNYINEENFKTLKIDRILPISYILY